MKNHKTTLFLLCVTLILAVITVTARWQEPSKQPRPAPYVYGKVDEEQWPLVNFDAPEPVEPEKRAKRRAKSARYYREHTVYEPPDRPGVTYKSLITNEWEVGLPALPASRSDAIVIGEVLDAQAFVTDNKQGVYSEFNVRVGEILKNDGCTPFANGNVITTERVGGRVKFPSNRILPVSIAGQGMPRVGLRYLFFLKRFDGEWQDYHILTAYELRDGRVSPLDGIKSDGGSLWKFDEYEDWDESAFIKAVQDAIAK
jgi:hypothetical protein